MILFLLGLVLGAAISACVAGTLVHIRAHDQAKDLTYDLGLLRARLRSLVRLAEAGLLTPDTVEAANVLNEVHDLVIESGDVPGLADVAVEGSYGSEDSMESVAGR